MFQIGMALTVGFSVGGMVSTLLAQLIHPAPRPLKVFQMIAVRMLFTYYVAVFALLWLLQKCSPDVCRALSQNDKLRKATWLGSL
jgi:dipeptide/tripeptide permease